MKKFSFSISQSSKPPNQVPKKRSQTFDDADAKPTEEASRSYVSEFNPDEAPATEPAAAAVIAPLENTWDWRRHKKMKNLDLPISARSEDGLQFEAEALGAGADASEVTYGLTLRDRTENPGGAAGDAVLRRLKFDMAALPEDRGMEEFEGVSVEEFGVALISGYGWKEGRGIGRNAKEDAKIVEYTRRTDKQGLGFFSTDDRGGDSMKPNGSIGMPKEKDALLGKEVRIVGGREAGMKGRVLERLADGKLSLRLSKSDETVRVGARDVAELGSREEDRCLRRLRDERKAAAKEAPPSPPAWVARGIRVRVVSRELRGGGLYLKKGEVLDVVGPGVCDVSMEEGREVLQGVSQEALETVVPRRGGRVLVLLGNRRGVYGSLVERDSERQRGVVRDADSHELVDVRFEQIAEFVGDPSELGY